MNAHLYPTDKQVTTISLLTWICLNEDLKTSVVNHLFSRPWDYTPLMVVNRLFESVPRTRYCGKYMPV